MVERGEQRGADVDIEGADILVAGGRGLGKPEGFQLAEELAKAFGGDTAVAATRVVVDAGWYPYAAQNCQGQAGGPAAVRRSGDEREAGRGSRGRDRKAKDARRPPPLGRRHTSGAAAGAVPLVEP